MKDWRTTFAGFLTLGLTAASFIVKNQDTKTTLQGLAAAMGSAGLMLAKDAGVVAPPVPQAPAPPAVVVVNSPPADPPK